MTEPKPAPRKRGPKPKPAGERYIMRSFRFPPDLWAEVVRQVPEGERSEFLCASLRRALEEENQ